MYSSQYNLIVSEQGLKFKENYKDFILINYIEYINIFIIQTIEAIFNSRLYAGLAGKPWWHQW